MRTAATSFRYYVAAIGAGIAVGWLLDAIGTAIHWSGADLVSLLAGYLVFSLIWVGIARSGAGSLAWRLALIWAPAAPFALMLIYLLYGAFLSHQDLFDRDGAAMGAFFFMMLFAGMAVVCGIGTVGALADRSGDRPTDP